MNNNNHGKLVIDDKLISLDVKVENNIELLEFMSNKLLDNGYVYKSYLKAVLKREKKFPTGIKTSIAGIAIPHTDNEHVKHSAIAVGILDEPVTFSQMGSGEEVEVNIVLMLAIKQPDKQLDMLQKIIGIIQDEELILSLIESKDVKRIKNILVKQLSN